MNDAVRPENVGRGRCMAVRVDPDDPTSPWRDATDLEAQAFFDGTSEFVDLILSIRTAIDD